MNDPQQADGSRRLDLIGASITLLILPTLAVTLRFLSRWISRAGYWWDDLAITIGMTFALGINIVVLLDVRYAGFGKHLPPVQGPQPPRVEFVWFKFLYIFEFMYVLAQWANKIAIILFLYRIFPVRQFRRILYYATAFVMAFAISCLVTTILQCLPIQAFWKTLAGSLSKELGGHCVDVRLYFLVSGAINTVTDFTLLAMLTGNPMSQPIPLLWRLHTSFLQKIVLTGMFTLGLVVCVLSIVRLIALSQLQNADITWTYVTPAIWTAAESSVTVVSACLPSLRPLFARIICGTSSKTTRLRRPKLNTRPGLSSHRSLTSSSWRSGNGKDSYDDGSFNRLPEAEGERWHHGAGGGGWTGGEGAGNRVKAYGSGGGRKGAGGSGGSGEEFEIGDVRPTAPLKGILVSTTVVQEISERLNYRDELF